MSVEFGWSLAFAVCGLCLLCTRCVDSRTEFERDIVARFMAVLISFISSLSAVQPFSESDDAAFSPRFSPTALTERRRVPSPETLLDVVLLASSCKGEVSGDEEMWLSLRGAGESFFLERKPV